MATFQEIAHQLDNPSPELVDRVTQANIQKTTGSTPKESLMQKVIGKIKALAQTLTNHSNNKQKIDKGIALLDEIASLKIQPIAMQRMAATTMCLINELQATQPEIPTADEQTATNITHEAIKLIKQHKSQKIETVMEEKLEQNFTVSSKEEKTNTAEQTDENIQHPKML